MNQVLSQFVDDFNDAWLQGDYQSLESLLHDDVIFLAPDLKTKVLGRTKCIQSLKDYVNNSSTNVFELRKKDIKVWADTAVILIEYLVEYDFDLDHYKEIGTENWVLKHHHSKWELIWRAIISIKPVNV